MITLVILGNGDREMMLISGCKSCALWIYMIGERDMLHRADCRHKSFSSPKRTTHLRLHLQGRPCTDTAHILSYTLVSQIWPLQCQESCYRLQLSSALFAPILFGLPHTKLRFLQSQNFPTKLLQGLNSFEHAMKSLACARQSC